MKTKRILAINTGSTSTKIALYTGSEALMCETLRHPQEELAQFTAVMDQYPYREKAILHTLQEHNIDLRLIDAVVGRGGLLHPLASGTYEINDLMLRHLNESGIHASNLACILAHKIAAGCSVPSYTVDPVVVDELEDVARYTGCKEIKRYSIWHALNQKAVARNYAESRGTPYEALNLIVAHIGGGCSIGAHRRGRVVDVTNALSGEGSFTAERAGSLPVEAVIELCVSGKYGSPDQLKQALISKMGLLSHLGTNDGRVVRERIKQGDAEAESVYQAMAYQISKEIGAAAAVLKGEIDAIILTGGFAYDQLLMNWIIGHVSFLAPVKIFPGEDEMSALVTGVLRVLDGTESARVYEG